MADMRDRERTIFHYAYRVKNGWACSVCSISYNSKFDATLCCAYNKRVVSEEVR